MTVHVFGHKSLLIVLLGAPMLLGGCESFKTEKERMESVQATTDQASSELKATNEKLDALSQRLDGLYNQRQKK